MFNVNFTKLLVAVIVVLGAASLLFLMPRKEMAQVVNDQNVELRMDLLGYIDYSDLNFSLAKQKGDVVLFFAATRWCQSCSELDKEIVERVDEIPGDLTILKVDYDNDKAMDAKYGITLQHSLVLLDENGQELTRWVGGDFEEMMERVLRQKKPT